MTLLAVNLNMAEQKHEKRSEAKEVETSAENTTEEGINENVKEGTHAIYLRKAIDSTFKKCLGSIKLKHFMVYYASVKDPNKKKTLELIYKQFQEGFLKAVEADLNETYEEENIVPLLNGLNRLSEDAPNEVAWRPSGVPEDDVRAHLMAVKLRHRDKLKAIIKELDKETVKLKAQVLPTRKRIAEMKSKIQDKRLKLASRLEELPNKDLEDLLHELGASNQQ